jgi:hypothetical protein
MESTIPKTTAHPQKAHENQRLKGAIIAIALGVEK